eukprot:COSAG02_NODE_58095_length_278_cov_0.955307_2_plen_32_part_01
MSGSVHPTRLHTFFILHNYCILVVGTSYLVLP